MLFYGVSVACVCASHALLKEARELSLCAGEQTPVFCSVRIQLLSHLSGPQKSHECWIYASELQASIFPGVQPPYGGEGRLPFECPVSPIPLVKASE